MSNLLKRVVSPGGGGSGPIVCDQTSLSSGGFPSNNATVVYNAENMVITNVAGGPNSAAGVDANTFALTSATVPVVFEATMNAVSENNNESGFGLTVFSSDFLALSGVSIDLGTGSNGSIRDTGSNDTLASGLAFPTITPTGPYRVHIEVFQDGSYTWKTQDDTGPLQSGSYTGTGSMVGKTLSAVSGGAAPFSAAATSDISVWGRDSDIVMSLTDPLAKTWCNLP